MQSRWKICVFIFTFVHTSLSQDDPDEPVPSTTTEEAHVPEKCILLDNCFHELHRRAFESLKECGGEDKKHEECVAPQKPKMEGTEALDDEDPKKERSLKELIMDNKLECSNIAEANDIMKDQYLNCRNSDPEEYCIQNMLGWIRQLYPKCEKLVKTPPKPKSCEGWTPGTPYPDTMGDYEYLQNVFAKYKMALSLDTNGDYLINPAFSKPYPRNEHTFQVHPRRRNVTLHITVCEPPGSYCSLGKNNKTVANLTFVHINNECSIPAFDEKDRTENRTICRKIDWNLDMGKKFKYNRIRIEMDLPSVDKSDPSKPKCMASIRIQSQHLAKANVKTCFMCRLRWEKTFDIDLTGLPKDLEFSLNYIVDVKNTKISLNTTREEKDTTNENEETGEDSDRDEFDISYGANIPIDILEIGFDGKDRTMNEMEKTFGSTDTDTRSIELTKEFEGTQSRNYENRFHLKPGYRYQRDHLALFCEEGDGKSIIDVPRHSRTYMGDYYMRENQCGGIQTEDEDWYEKATVMPGEATKAPHPGVPAMPGGAAGAGGQGGASQEGEGRDEKKFRLLSAEEVAAAVTRPRQVAALGTALLIILII